MAPTIGTQTSSSSASASSASFAHVVEAGCQLLILRVYIYNGGSADPTPSATYNGVAMTQIVTKDSSPSRVGTTILALVNPAIGSNTVAISWGGGTLAYYAEASDILGANSLPNNANSGTGTGTSPSLSITSATGSLVVDAIGTNNHPTITSTQTSDFATFSVSSMSGNGSHAAGAASVSMGYTISFSTEWSFVGCNIDPATPVGGGAVAMFF